MLDIIAIKTYLNHILGYKENPQYFSLNSHLSAQRAHLNTLPDEILPIKIISINPIYSPDKKIHRLNHIPTISPNTSIDYIALKNGPRTIASESDVNDALPHIIERIKLVQTLNYDAMVIRCMEDPGLSEARRLLTIPVAGSKESAIKIALTLGKTPHIIYPEGIEVKDLTNIPKDRILKLLLTESQKAIKQRADVLIIGCTLIEHLSSELQKLVNIPVLGNFELAVIDAEMQVISKKI